MSFNNLYYKRTAGTAKACYVCYKPTTTVLATMNTVDFLYTCEGHLSDSGFAVLVKEEGKKVSAEEIAKVKAEWEEKQKKKTDKDKEKDKEKKEDKEDEKKEQVKPTHERYILHRDFFAMRQAEHKRRRQATQAQEIVTRLPSAPCGNV